ncbi:M23 family metallopeptidase [Vibrio sp. LaRot3]|uniref:M23 family metallopeptidase n=1 Tax=Vibrio sp. LaRot3 TaxID=2998829 RepID=UPI0022CE2F66|nr:peptidoglycan DD-metalloendopeptidase family protein [Vibrio sp. LaRot3]MDA0149766.1 peptidoglycan DD-metalloendopeptidase family protein [Vibrio sp. LaRot3]
MSKKITISIPAGKGEQCFSLSRKHIFIAFAATTTAILGTATWLVHSQKQVEALEQQLTEVSEQKSNFESLYSDQLDTTHSLSQELEEKSSQLNILGQRIYDVESVLGLANEETEGEQNLEDRLDAAAVDSAVRATMFRMIPNDAPLDYLRISSSYGRRTNPITGKRHTHTGIDLTCKRGTDIIAPADGVIETVRPSKKGFGNFLTIRHSFGFMSSFAHLHRFKVKSGQFVSKGDVIASCGNSGNSTGPHLHYEVRFLGRALNPQYTMDWTPENFDYLFEKEKKVKWKPLVELVSRVVKLQINLTNAPYVDSSIKTAVNKETSSEKVESTN